MADGHNAAAAQIGKVEAELAAIESNPQAVVMEALHVAAYNGGLGNPLVATRAALKVRVTHRNRALRQLSPACTRCGSSHHVLRTAQFTGRATASSRPCPLSPSALARRRSPRMTSMSSTLRTTPPHASCSRCAECRRHSTHTWPRRLRACFERAHSPFLPVLYHA